MTFTPLFFLPRSARIWAFHQAMAEHLLDTPVVALFASADFIGIEFWYRGDTVIWTWPWRRKGLAPYISLGFTGTGSLGDARFWTLGEIDATWKGYEEACANAESFVEAADFSSV